MVLKIEGLEGLDKYISSTLEACLLSVSANIASDDIAPRFIVFDAVRKKSTFVSFYFDSKKDKEEASARVRSLAAKMSADAVAFICRSYGVDRPGAIDEIGPGKKYRSVKDHPAARETVMVSIETYKGYYYGKAEISKVDGVRTLGEFQFRRDLSPKSLPFAWLLPEIQ